jgi:hypothetical protein
MNVANFEQPWPAPRYDPILGPEIIASAKAPEARRSRSSHDTGKSCRCDEASPSPKWKVLIKPNFNTADPRQARPTTSRCELVLEMKTRGAQRPVGDRAGCRSRSP